MSLDAILKLTIRLYDDDNNNNKNNNKNDSYNSSRVHWKRAVELG
jgi:hypothetical protein